MIGGLGARRAGPRRIGDRIGDGDKDSPPLPLRRLEVCWPGAQVFPRKQDTAVAE